MMLYSFLRNELYCPYGQLYSPSVSYIFASQKLRKPDGFSASLYLKCRPQVPTHFPKGNISLMRSINITAKQYHFLRSKKYHCKSRYFTVGEGSPLPCRRSEFGVRRNKPLHSAPHPPDSLFLWKNRFAYSQRSINTAPLIS